MKYFIALVDDPLTNDDLYREDLTVLSFSIEEAEGQFPMLELEIENPGVNQLFSLTSSYVILSELDNGNLKILFRGRITGLPTGMSGNTVTLEARSELAGTKGELRELAVGVDQNLYANPLFIEEANEELLDLLKARPYTFTVDRRTLSAGLSHLHADPSSQQTFFLTDADVLRGSVDMSLQELPPSKLTLNGTVNFTQRATRTADIGSYIDAKLSGSQPYMVTFTPEAMIDALNFDVAQTGYSIDFNESFVSDGLGISKSLPYSLNGFSRNVGVLVDHYNIHYKALATATYEQERSETVTVSINCPQSTLFGSEERTENIGDLTAGSIDLVRPKYQSWKPFRRYAAGSKVIWNGQVWQAKQDGTFGSKFDPGFWTKVNEATAGVDSGRDYSKASFLDSEAGKEAVQYLVNIAHAEMMRRVRFINVSFEVPRSAVDGITLDTCVNLTSIQVPGGRVVGKVIGYRLSNDGEAAITLGVVLGNEEAGELPATQGAYGAEDYFAENYEEQSLELLQSAENVNFSLEKDDLTEYINVSLLGAASYIIEECEYTNNGDYQSQFDAITTALGNVTPWTKTKFTDSYEGGSNHVDELDVDDLNRQLSEAVNHPDIILPEISIKFRDIASTGSPVTRNYRASAHIAISSGIQLI